MRRIVVTGSSGSGKTTLARTLGTRLGLPVIELDALFWGPGWTEPDTDAFRARVDEATAGDAWVLDGHYSRARDIYLAKVDTIVWLDLPLRTCLWRSARRAIARAHSGEELWGSGNRETWRKIVAQDSLLWWIVKTHRRRRREDAAQFADPALSHARVIRLRSPGAVGAWLAGVRVTR